MKDTTVNTSAMDATMKRAELLKLMGQNGEDIINLRDVVSEVKKRFAIGTDCSFVIFQKDNCIHRCEVHILPSSVPKLLDLIETDIRDREELTRELSKQLVEVL